MCVMLLPSSHNNFAKFINFTKAVNKLTGSPESSLRMKNQSLHIKQKTIQTYFLFKHSPVSRNYFFRIGDRTKHVYRGHIGIILLPQEFERNDGILISTQILETTARCNPIKIISKTEVTWILTYYTACTFMLAFFYSKADLT